MSGKYFNLPFMGNVPARAVVHDGYGGYLVAPAEEGTYALIESYDPHNDLHLGWIWAKDYEGECRLNYEELYGVGQA